MKSKQHWYRLLHRDLGYFYLGLILSFAISGLALNHRDTFNSRTYVVETKPVQLPISDSLKLGSENHIKSISAPLAKTKVRAVRVKGNKARIYFKDAFASVDLNTGKGEIEYLKTIPLLGHMSILHKSMNTWWVWFSDIFAIALIIISITGVLLAKGKYGFKRRGWILTVSGLVFPIIILFIM